MVQTSVRSCYHRTSRQPRCPELETSMEAIQDIEAIQSSALASIRIVAYAVFFYGLIFSNSCLAQDDFLKKDQYQIGPDERLLITVHVWGEVRTPGGFLVPDDTDILELISKAGGPTEFSNLSDVKITRGLTSSNAEGQDTESGYGGEAADDARARRKVRKQVIKVNLKKLLDNERHYTQLPRLQPGDVVRVGRNAWFTWQAVIRVVSQVAIIVQAWYWYSRIE
ncbi:SLBB domain-containing protein [candidate division KSB1 bacterium]|nr:SLBB domain-containing protein [candidate division KSB1 bacterium]